MNNPDSRLQRVLEPEVMDSPEEAHDYNEMDHSAVNKSFVDDFIVAGFSGGDVLDVGTGTALIPIELVKREVDCRIMAVDLAAHMLDRAKMNIAMNDCSERIQLSQIDGKKMPFSESMFDAVMSNSIIHHVPNPIECLQEAIRVVKIDGLVFVRDLLRPYDDSQVATLVEEYAGNENIHSRQMFEDSLRAALSLKEVRSLVGELGYEPETVQQTTDRHWTWIARRIA